ncbi:MAG: enoyl-CoA hydratase/isomerase family protein [Deltaproteobacteria bacterium]|nr:enoyl-CoA hydratase/isomerase family protein [Deltaproteobacteria bacterium]
MLFENFDLEEQGTTVILRINRPKALNALNGKVLKEFSGILDELNRRKDIRAVVLTGAGEKAFIAGADIAEMSGMSQILALEFARLGQTVTQKLECLNVPVIAAVNGYALGGGCEIAISCDFILASTTAVFGQPEVSLGLITGFGGAVRLADFVGWPLARELIYTGRRVDAIEALRIGLVNRVVEPARLLDEALVVAESIGSNSPQAVRKVKAVMTKVRSEAVLAAKLDLEARAFSTVFTTFDQREGTKAFLEKRKAQFKGE